jgi:beta-xylosidase
VNCYRSADLYEWAYVGRVAVAPSAWSYDYLERPHVVYNPDAASDRRYVLWCHLDVSGYTAGAAGAAYAAAPEGPFTFAYHGQPNGYDSFDCSLFVDDDGTAYFVSDGRVTSSGNPRIPRLHQLGAAGTPTDWTTLEGAVTAISATSVGEGHIVFRHTDGYYIWFHSNYSGYGTTAFDCSYRRASTLAGLASDTDHALFSSTPASGTAIRSGQTTAIVRVGGRLGYLVMFDTWDPRSSGTLLLTRSRYVWQPLTDADATAGTPTITPDTTWALSDLPAAPSDAGPAALPVPLRRTRSKSLLRR